MALERRCDRCRKLISGPRCKLVAYGRPGNNDRHVSEDFDLCRGCASQFNDFLSGKAVDRVRDV